MLTESDVRARGGDVPLLVSWGMGVNSTAALIEMYKRGVRPDLITAADTGGEKPGSYAYIPVFQQWLASVGFPPVTVVRLTCPDTGDASLEEACLRLEVLPSRTFGMGTCAQRWKIEPQSYFLFGRNARKKEHRIAGWEPALRCRRAGKKLIRVLGYDGGEGDRAKIDEDKDFRYWFPLIEWGLDRDACIASIRSVGLAPPPKSACFFCPSSTKQEVIQLHAESPDLFRRAVAMESRGIASGKCHSVAGLGRHWSWAKLIEMGSDEREALAEMPVESCTVCVDGD